MSEMSLKRINKETTVVLCGEFYDRAPSSYARRVERPGTTCRSSRGSTIGHMSAGV